MQKILLYFVMYSQADENMRSELEEDVKEECLKLGPVDAIKVNYSSVKQF